MRRRLLVLLMAALAPAWSTTAHGDCAPEAHVSTCFDADTLWPHAGQAYFHFVGGTSTTPPGEVAAGWFMTYLTRPVVLALPSLADGGSEAVAVDHVWDSTALFSLGLSERIDVGVALPAAIDRTGVGISPLASQTSTPLPRTALRDVRIGATYRVLGAPADAFVPSRYGVAARFELSLPTGDESSFAGDRSAVAIPSVSGEARVGPFVGGAELGARLRQTSDLAGATVGSQLLLALGVGADVLADGKLGFFVDMQILPTLTAQHDLAIDSTTGNRVVSGDRRLLVPSEWEASIRSTDVLARGFALAFGAGTSLALSGESGLTSPRYRMIFSIRYSPPADEER